MDPNATLAEIRRLVSDGMIASFSRADDPVVAMSVAYGTLAARLEALDDWLSKGGFYPADWGMSASDHGRKQFVAGYDAGYGDARDWH